MKKKLIIIILVVIIIEFAALIGLIAYWTHSSSPNPIETFTDKKLKENTSFNIKAEVEISENLVSIDEDIVLEKAQNSVLVYVPSINKAKTNILMVSSNNVEAQTSLKDTNLQIQLKELSQIIHIKYEIILDKSTDTLSYSDSQTNLTNFLVTPSVSRDKQVVPTYKCPYGDPYIYNMNNYYVLFKTKKDIQIAAPGKKEEYLFGANKISIFEATDLRDFPAVLFSSADVYTEKVGNTNIVFINSKATKENVNIAYNFAVKNIGLYPYDTLYIVKTPLNQSGMEFSNMIFLSNTCFNNREDLKRVSYHEVFHQWFYGIIGTDQLDEPFFDEGMVNYLAMFLSKDTFKASYNNRFESLKLKNYTSREEYYDLAYNNSAVYFHLIHEKLGNNFYGVLKKLYKEKKYSIAYFKDFLKYVDEFSRGN